MNGIDVYGFASLLGLALTIGTIGGMHLGRWADEASRRAAAAKTRRDRAARLEKVRYSLYLIN